MTSSALPSSDVSKYSKEELIKENAALEAEIKQLKDKLGLTAIEEKQEKERVMGMFQMFDRDSNGYIDPDEFELLAFQCGVPLTMLTEESKKKILSEINPKGDNKITFDDFYKWVRVTEEKETKESKSDSKEEKQMKMLRMRLQSRAWVKGMQGLKEKLVRKVSTMKEEKKKSGEEKKVIAKTEEKKASVPTEEKKESKEEKKEEETKEVRKGSRFQITVGDFKEAKAGIYMQGGPDTQIARDIREQLQAPEECKVLAFIEFALKDNVDQTELTTLVGMVENLLSLVPFNEINNAAPFPVYHSHAVKGPIELKDGQKVMRIVFYSPFDPEAMIQMMTGQQTPLNDWGSGEFKIELPFSIGDLFNGDFRFVPEILKVKLLAQSKLDPKLQKDAEAALDSIPDEQKLFAGLRMALTKFFKGMDVLLSFMDFNEFFSYFPTPDAYTSNPVADFKHQLDAAREVPVADTLQGYMAMLPMMVAQTGQVQIYNTVRNCIAGLSAIHFQFNDSVLRLSLKGLDFLRYLPEIPAEILSMMGTGELTALPGM